MDFSNIEPNSHKYNEKKNELEARKIQKVISGEATKKKKAVGRKLRDIFVTSNFDDVKTYVFYDVIVPAIKDGLYDVFDSAISMLFFGDASGRRRKPKASEPGFKINYGGYFASDGPRKERKSAPDIRTRSVYAYEDLVIPSKGDAQIILDNMYELLSKYEYVSVFDLYTLAGITPNPTDEKYGWTDLRGAKIEGSPRRGWWLSLPRCSSLD